MNLIKSQKNRVLLVLSFITLTLTYFLPLWEIGIFAPQYPEGLNLTIWLNKMTGDLNNVNILNHYVGMKVITPNEIPEFTLFPKLVAGLLVLSLICIIIPKIWSLIVYFFSFSAFAIFALYDFWKWEYDYGHNLNPDAPIKVPGMSYQPPLFGKETLLNITVYSFPGPGGWMMFASFALLIYVLWVVYKERQT